MALFLERMKNNDDDFKPEKTKSAELDAATPNFTSGNRSVLDQVDKFDYFKKKSKNSSGSDSKPQRKSTEKILPSPGIEKHDEVFEQNTSAFSVASLKSLLGEKNHVREEMDSGVGIEDLIDSESNESEFYDPLNEYNDVMKVPLTDSDPETEEEKISTDSSEDFSSMFSKFFPRKREIINVI